MLFGHCTVLTCGILACRDAEDACSWRVKLRVGLCSVRVNRVSWASAAESWEVRTVGARSNVSFGSDSRVPPRGRAVLLAVSGRWLPCHRIRQMTRLMRCLTLTSVRKLRSWTRFTLRSFVCLHRSPRTNALPNLTHLRSILRPARHRYNC